MIYDISKFMKNEMFGSKNEKKAGSAPGLSVIINLDLIDYL